jgi:hypothetical protein
MVMVEMAQVVAVPVVTRMGTGVAVEVEFLAKDMRAVEGLVIIGLVVGVVLVVWEVLEISRAHLMAELVLQMLFWELIIIGVAVAAAPDTLGWAAMEV